MSGGGTLDSVLVSTTRSGCCFPIFAGEGTEGRQSWHMTKEAWSSGCQSLTCTHNLFLTPPHWAKELKPGPLSGVSTPSLAQTLTLGWYIVGIGLSMAQFLSLLFFLPFLLFRLAVGLWGMTVQGSGPHYSDPASPRAAGMLHKVVPARWCGLDVALPLALRGGCLSFPNCKMGKASQHPGCLGPSTLEMPLEPL